MNPRFIIPDSFIPYMEKLESILSENRSASHVVSKDDLLDAIKECRTECLDPHKILQYLEDYYYINNITLEITPDGYRLKRHTSLIHNYSRRRRRTVYGLKSSWWYIPDDYLICLRAAEKTLSDSINSIDKEKLCKIIYEKFREIIYDKYRETIEPDTPLLEEILLWLERFYDECGGNILEVDRINKKYRLKKATTLIRDYKVDYARARILLEYIYEEKIKSNDPAHCVHKMALLAELHRYINSNKVNLTISRAGNWKRKDDKSNETELSRVYRDNANDALKILSRVGLIREVGKSKTDGGLDRTAYDFSYAGLMPTVATSAFNIAQLPSEKRDELFKEAIGILQSKTTIKESAARIAYFKGKIVMELQKFRVETLTDRKAYHWLCTSLLLRLGNDKSDIIVQDIMTYMSFNNSDPLIDAAPSEWNVFDPNIKVWQTVANSLGPNISLPSSVSMQEFKMASIRLIDRINELLSGINLSNEGRLYYSVLYVRAIIATLISHEYSNLYLETAYKYAVNNNYNYNHNDLDICLLSLRVLSYHDDSLSLNQKAKSILFVMSKFPRTPDVLKTYISIYLDLISNSQKLTHRNEYIKKCVEFIDDFEQSGYELDYAYLYDCFLYLGRVMGDIPANDFSTRLIKLWSVANTQHLSSKTPILQFFIAQVFVLAYEAIAVYTHELIDFGVSVPFLACKMLIDIFNIDGINRNAAMSDWTIRRLLEIVYSFYKGVLGVNSSPLKVALYSSSTVFSQEWMSELCDNQKLHSDGIEYARKCIASLDTNDLSAIDNIADICDIRLSMIKPLYALGRYSEAEKEISYINQHLGAIINCYSENERSNSIQSVLDNYESFKWELRMYPMTPHYFRLQYILDLIEESGKTDEYSDFYEKWRTYVCLHKFHPKESSEEQRKVFESDSFDILMNKVENEIAYSFKPIDCQPLNDEYLVSVYQKLRYLSQVQSSFVLEFGCDELTLFSEPKISEPCYDQLFEVYRGLFLLDENTSTIFLIKNLDKKEFDKCNPEELEFYLNLCFTYSNALYLASAEKRDYAYLYLKILKSYASSFEDGTKYSVKTALIFSLLAELLMEGERPDTDKAEQYLYMARHELTKNPDYIKQNAEALSAFVHVCFNLTEVYGYSDKESACIDIWQQLKDIPNIPASLDLARTMANVSDAYRYSMNDKEQAYEMLKTAIQTLRLLPLSENVEHYLSIYESYLTEFE